MKLLSAFLLLVVIPSGFLSHSASASSPEPDKVMVAVFCKGSNGKIESQGSGVLVSRKGHVLTARHVAPKGLDCAGSIGAKDANNAKPLVRQPIPTEVDASLMRFQSSGPYPFVSFCTLEDWMIRRKIFVAGFHGESKTGVASYREGVLSTVLPNESGILETDGQTIAGMSGGPVFSKNLAGIIGIVTGADFSRTGAISYYGVLSAEFFAGTFGLTKSTRECFREQRAVDLDDKTANWDASEGELALGIRSEDATCYLSAIRGLLNHEEDSIGVFVRFDEDQGEHAKHGEYVLRGSNKYGGRLGASVRCIYQE